MSRLMWTSSASCSRAGSKVMSIVRWKMTAASCAMPFRRAAGSGLSGSVAEVASTVQILRLKVSASDRSAAPSSQASLTAWRR